MGDFKFICPHCNQKLECDESLENKIVACPACNNEIVPQRDPFEGTIKVATDSNSEAVKHSLSSSIEESLPQSGQSQIVINNYCGSMPQAPSQSPGNANMPKQRSVYIVLGLFLGGLGIHNFYAGYKTEASIQLALGIVGILTSPPGFVLNLCVGVWALANILCREKDVRGRPML